MPKNLVTIAGLHTGGIRALAGTYRGEDGPVLITGGEDRNLNISNALTGEFIKQVPAFTGRPGHPGHRDKIYAIDMWTYKSSSYIVSTGEDRLIRIFALDDMEAIRTMEGHTDFIHTLIVIDVMSQAVTASYDRTTRIWDLHSGEELHQFRQPKVLFAMDYCVKSLTHFATGNANYIHIWNTEDWKPDNRSQIELELRSHTRTVTALAYPKMDLLLSGSDDAHICVWNPQVPDCPLLQKLGSQSPIYKMKWYDDGCAFFLVTAHWGKPSAAKESAAAIAAERAAKLGGAVAAAQLIADAAIKEAGEATEEAVKASSRGESGGPEAKRAEKANEAKKAALAAVVAAAPPLTEAEEAADIAKAAAAGVFLVRIWNLEPKEKEKDIDESSSEELDSDEEAPPKVMLYCYPIDKGQAHTAPVLNLAILDDGKPHVVVEKRKSDDEIDTKLIASLSQDGTVRTWDFRPAIETVHRVRFLATAQTSRMV